MDSEIERVRLLYLDLLKKCPTRSFLDERYDRIPRTSKPSGGLFGTRCTALLIVSFLRGISFSFTVSGQPRRR